MAYAGAMDGLSSWRCYPCKHSSDERMTPFDKQILGRRAAWLPQVELFCTRTEFMFDTAGFLLYEINLQVRGRSTAAGCPHVPLLTRSIIAKEAGGPERCPYLILGQWSDRSVEHPWSTAKSPGAARENVRAKARLCPRSKGPAEHSKCLQASLL